MKRIGIISNGKIETLQTNCWGISIDNIHHARFEFVKIIIHIHILEGREDSVVLYLESSCLVKEFLWFFCKQTNYLHQWLLWMLAWGGSVGLQFMPTVVTEVVATSTCRMIGGWIFQSNWPTLSLTTPTTAIFSFASSIKGLHGHERHDLACFIFANAIFIRITHPKIELISDLFLNSPCQIWRNYLIIAQVLRQLAPLPLSPVCCQLPPREKAVPHSLHTMSKCCELRWSGREQCCNFPTSTLTEALSRSDLLFY
jgi:hypothetical protein